MADLIRFADLNPKRVHRFELAPDGAAMKILATDLGLQALRKTRLTGELKARAKRDWELTARLGATVVQDCVVTLDPVTTRLDEDVHRIYMADFDDPGESDDETVLDDTSEPLPATLDLNTLLSEALALALPQFPRSDGAELSETVVTEPGAEPLTDEASKPFAGLADLKKKLEE